MMNAAPYYYADESKKPQGPFSREELQSLFKEGRIKPQTLIIEEGSSQWVDWGSFVNATASTDVVARLAGLASSSTSATISEIIWGLILVWIQGFLLPYQLIKQSLLQLGEWGRKKVLPSETSDVPVLTFLTVVSRPYIHVLFTVISTLAAIFFLFSDTRPLGSFAGYSYGLSARIGNLFLILIVSYFGNLLIGLFFDLCCLFVTMANSLKTMSKK